MRHVLEPFAGARPPGRQHASAVHPEAPWCRCWHATRPWDGGSLNPARPMSQLAPEHHNEEKGSALERPVGTPALARHQGMLAEGVARRMALLKFPSAR